MSDAWMVGRYVIMPDHLHLFCAPVNEQLTLEHWVTFWKRTFKRLDGVENRRFQMGGFHHRCANKRVTTSDGIMGAAKTPCAPDW